MKNKTKLLAAASIITASMVANSNAFAHMEPKIGSNMEKCYGIAKAGKNQCASKANKHGCMGMAKKDNDPNEWIKVPKDTCKDAGGNTEAKG